MKFDEFLKIYKAAPLIDSSTFGFHEKPQDLRRQVRGWVEKGYLFSLKRGIYIFGPQYRKSESLPMFVANFLVNPSYISMEYALGLYDLIPERVTVVTSVTTKKTRSFTNCVGRFDYQSVKKELFWGFQVREYSGCKVFIALPEKALADYFYLNGQVQPELDYFSASMRLQGFSKR